MKKSVLFAFSLLLVVSSFAQTKKTPPAPKKDSMVLKNALDSFSYAVGMSIALQYKEFGVKTLNTTAVMAAVNDVLKQHPHRFSADQANYILNNYINTLMAGQAAENKKAGEDFLAKNKAKPGVTTLPSGLQYQVVREGSGPKPGINDTVTVHYVGTLIDGTQFDNSLERGAPVTFTVGGVIAGWTEALQLMNVGSRWKLFVPAALGYGNYSPPGSNIPPGSTLVFDVELISIGSKK